MPRNDSELLKYYRNRAPEYEQIYYRDAPQRQAELAAEGDRLQQLTTGKTVLDLACGTGYWLQRMSQTAAGIVAADISPEMIREARRKSYGCPVDFVRADLNQVPLAGRGFDVVALGFWFSHHPLQDYDRLFDIIEELSAPHGVIWMIDNNPPAEGLSHNSVGTDAHGNNLIKRRLDSGPEYLIIKNYFDEPQLRTVFAERFRIERLTYGVCYWSVVVETR